jgi:hypothetical protein
MRLGQAIFFGAAAALLTLAAPTLARDSSANSQTTKATEAPASSDCHAYQQAADGSWTQLPCQEMGSKASAPPHSAATGGTGEAQ